ncbi:unnamed protein product, partial [Mesorhabditis spiculigera]
MDEERNEDALGLFMAFGQIQEQLQGLNSAQGPEIEARIREFRRLIVTYSHQIKQMTDTLAIPPCPCDDCDDTRHSDLNRYIESTYPSSSNSSRQNTYAGPKPNGICRKQVREYAKVHGGVAAAKKFGVPPPISTYYTNKDAQGNVKPVAKPQMPDNPAHTSGSPGFLRGRGRGRPKLVGDQLDNDLLDFMVKVKQRNPHSYNSAAQALPIARRFILEKAPGLLVEQGGPVELKMTWATKLMNRVQEALRIGRSQHNQGPSTGIPIRPRPSFDGEDMAKDMLAQIIMDNSGKETSGQAGLIVSATPSKLREIQFGENGELILGKPIDDDETGSIDDGEIEVEPSDQKPNF